MASARKKQDEKNMKTLRELAGLPQNKYCFDCNQRGPTYVNVTIGSFVCTKCSGMLRGITPPHRVKSISMATFTQDEIDLVRSRGNDHCRRTWLGLHDGTLPLNSNDEQTIRDFMLEKYERKRYYLDPSQQQQNVKPERPRQPPNLIEPPRPRANGTATVPPPQNTHRTRPEVIHKANLNNNDFVADFDKADIFQMSNGTSNGISNGTSNGNFANFDKFVQTPVVNGNGAGLLTPAPLSSSNLTNGANHGATNGTATNGTNGWTQSVPAPIEDKYAALKDLDNALKSQSTLDWGSTGSNGSLYSSPTPTGSMYSSSSPQGSLFGSPSQSNFLSAFAQENGTANGSSVSNPFNANGAGFNGWSTSVAATNGGGFPANPFKANGFSQGFQPVAPMGGGGSAWPPNPFKVGAGVMNSNNPFL